MADLMKVLGSFVVPLLLVSIGWRGIPKEKRTGALKRVAIMVGVVLAGTAAYVAVMVVMTPKWVAADCEIAAEQVSRGPQASEPTLAHEPFVAACQQLQMSAARCTQLDFVKTFPDGCRRYVDEIHGQLPKLDLGIPPRATK